MAWDRRPVEAYRTVVDSKEAAGKVGDEVDIGGEGGVGEVVAVGRRGDKSIIVTSLHVRTISSACMCHIAFASQGNLKYRLENTVVLRRTKVASLDRFSGSGRGEAKNNDGTCRG